MINQRSIHSLCNSKDLDDINKGLDLLIDNYNELIDKSIAWQDIINLTNLPEIEDDEISKREMISIKLKAIKFLTKEIPNKFETKEFNELFDILKAIRLVPFNLWIEKDLIWRYLIKLIDDDRPRLSTDGASVLRSMFIYVENKKRATDDLFRLIESENKYTKYCAIFTLGYRFEENEDKQRVWRKIYDISKTNDIILLRGIALSIGYIIKFLNSDEEKTESWEILNEFLHKQDDIIKLGSVNSLSISFRYLLKRHKEKAIRMLYQLIEESDNEDTISMIAKTLGHNYSDIIDKDLAYEYLMKLVNQDSLSIKCSANYSLGKVHIYKTAHSDKEKRKENLKEAIKYYQAAEDCSLYVWSNPSHFCKVFYQMFLELFYNKKVLGEEEIIEQFNLPLFSIKDQKTQEKLLNILKNSAFLLNKCKNVDLAPSESNKIFDELKYCCDKIVWTLDDIQPNYPLLTKSVREIIREESPDLNKISDVYTIVAYADEKVKNTNEIKEETKK